MCGNAFSNIIVLMYINGALSESLRWAWCIMYIVMGGSDGADSGGLGRSDSLDSILAHDLTNTLQIIEGLADLLLDRCDEPTAVDRLAAIKRQAVAANALIQTVCGMGDTTSQDHLDTVDAGRILEIETSHLRSVYADAEITVDVPEGITVRADDLLPSVFRNLVQNAVQHNDSPTPQVSVTARSNDSETIIVIEDDGPGLPDDVVDDLLGVERASRGSGIGIVRALADRYDATISVESGEGTTITMAFPTGRRSKDS